MGQSTNPANSLLLLCHIPLIHILTDTQARLDSKVTIRIFDYHDHANHSDAEASIVET